MKTRIFLFRGLVALLLASCLLIYFSAYALGQEKVKMATSTRIDARQYLPILGAMEGGYARANGLEMEWVAFRNPADMNRAVASGDIKLGIGVIASVVQAIAAGLPIIMVADLHPMDFYVFVLTDSPIKEPRGLKGTKIGMLRFASSAHAYGLVAVRALGLEKEVRFVSTGGSMETVAALKAKVIDASVQSLSAVAELKVRGEVRELLAINDYLPKGWLGQLLFSEKEYTKKNPDTVRRVIKSLLAGAQYTIQHPDWARDKMKTISRFSPGAANLLFNSMEFSRDGKIDRKAMENARKFLIDYGIVREDKTPPASELYSRDFTG